MPHLARLREPVATTFRFKQCGAYSVKRRFSWSDRLAVAVQYLLPHHAVSRLAGYAAQCEIAWFKTSVITWFARRYEVDMRDAYYEKLDAYPHFNAFFTRALKAEARPLASTEGGILSPADGSISQLGSIENGQVFQAKGHSFSLSALLGGNTGRAAQFLGGQFATVYLSPRDYHRVHMPIAGTLREMVYIPGRLFSVNPTTAALVPGLFARNERVVCLFDTAHGPMAVVLVGAMIVASIETVWAGPVCPQKRCVKVVGYSQQQPIKLQKGDELGHFKLGSTVIILFGPRQANWVDQLNPGSEVRYGQLLGNQHSGSS